MRKGCTYWAIISPLLCDADAIPLNLFKKLASGAYFSHNGQLLARTNGCEQAVTLHFVKKGLAIDAEGLGHLLAMPLVLV